MAQDNKYNGWTNYATWRINLEWFDGFNLADNGYDTKDAYELGQQLKEYVEEGLDSEGVASYAVSYALAFISDVNWLEIASHLQDAEKA